MSKRREKEEEGRLTGLFFIIIGVVAVLQWIFPQSLQALIGPIFLILVGYAIAIHYDKETTNEILGIVGGFVIDLFKLVFDLLSSLIRYVLKKEE